MALNLNSPLKLGQFYQLKFEEAEAKVQNIAIANWQANLGHQMKMRRFFLKQNWVNELHSVDISTSGQKGGVLFLYKRQTAPNQAQPEANPAFAVKLSDGPHQTLFAEYVLKHIGQAKIPKSLVLELDWNDFGNNATAGMKLVNLIRNNPHPNVGADQNKQAKYNTLINGLLSGNQGQPPLAEFLIVMKFFGGDPIAEPANALEKWLLIEGFTKPNNPNASDLTTSFTALSNAQKNSNEFQRIVDAINTNKRLLRSQDRMKKLGRVLAADTLIGNSDRFEGMNVGNAFFVNKIYANMRPNRVNNPVGVIDNDAFLPVYNPNQLHPDIQNTNGATPADKYLDYVLDSGYELDPINVNATVKLSRVKRLMENFEGNYLDLFFYPKFYQGQQFTLLEQLYADDGTRFNAPGTVPTFLINNIASPEWVQTKQWVKAGFVDGLDAIRQLDLDEYEAIYTHLLTRYGFNNNFDFTAFEVRKLYFSAATLNTVAGTFQFAGHNQVVQQIKQVLNQRHTLLPEVDQALAFGVQQNLIDQTRRQKISHTISLLQHAQQQALMPQVPQKYANTQRVKAVRCAILMAFADLVNIRIEQGRGFGPSVIQAMGHVGIRVRQLEQHRFEKSMRGGIRKTTNIGGNQEVASLGTFANIPTVTWQNLTQ